MNTRTAASPALEVGDQAFTGLDQLAWLECEHVVPRAGGGPHFVVVQQVGVDEHAQVGRVAEGGDANVGLWIRSAAERFDERFGIDTRLPNDAAEGAALDLAMQRHHTASCPTTHHHVTPPLTHHDEPETLEHADRFRSRDVWEFRQRQRCGTW